jgi:hypothetical protein
LFPHRGGIRDARRGSSARRGCPSCSWGIPRSARESDRRGSGQIEAGRPPCAAPLGETAGGRGEVGGIACPSFVIHSEVGWRRATSSAAARVAGSFMSQMTDSGPGGGAGGRPGVVRLGIDALGLRGFARGRSRPGTAYGTGGRGGQEQKHLEGFERPIRLGYQRRGGKRTAARHKSFRFNDFGRI